jgi:hypothetical protein
MYSGWNSITYWISDVSFLSKGVLLLTDENCFDLGRVVIAQDFEILSEVKSCLETDLPEFY